MKQEKEYFAFISYKREDEKWAKWLAHQLDNYKLPSTLNGKELPPSLRKTFRDVDELSAGNLPEQIYNALSTSDNLIVICSPRSAKSEWVNKEIEDFIEIKGGKYDHIFPFIIDGEPFSKEPSRECFPKALRALPDREERIGGNINEQGGRYAAVVKVIAGMLSVTFDSLWDRYEREQKKRRNWMITAGITAFLAIAGIAFWMYLQKQEVLRANWSMMENQTRAVTEKVSELIDSGNILLSQKLLLEVLPQNINDIDRPYVSDAEAALRKAEGMQTFKLCDYNHLTGKAVSNGAILSVDYDDGINLWNPESGALIKHFNEGEVYNASLSPNLKEMAIIHGHGGSSSDCLQDYKDIKIVDIGSGKCLKTLVGHKREVIKAVYSDDGKFLASSSWDGTVKIWDLTKKIPIKTFYGDSTLRQSTISESLDYRISFALGFSPNGKHVISTFEGRNMEVWDINNDNCIDTLKAHTGIIWSVDYSPNGKMFASAGDDKTVRIWDANKRDVIKTLTGHSQTILDVTFSKDSKFVVSSSSDSTIRVWDVTKGICVRQMNAHTVVMKAMFSPDGQSIIYSPNDNSVRVWKFKNIPVYNTTSFGKVACCQSGSLVVLSNMDEGVTAWNIEKKQFLFHLDDIVRVDCIDYSKFGNYILTMHSLPDERSRIYVWDVKANGFIREFKVKGIRTFGEHLRHAVFSPDEMCIASAEKDSTIRIWDMRTNKCVKEIKQDVYDIIHYSPDGKMLAVVKSWENKIYLIRISDGEIVKKFTGHKESISNMLFTNDGKLLITSSSDGSVNLWDINTGKCVKSVNLGMGKVDAISLSKDEKYIICVCGKKYIAVLDKESGTCLNKIESTGTVFAHLLKDNRTIAAASSNGKIQYYDFPPLQELMDKLRERFKDRKLTNDERLKFYLNME